MLSKNLHFHHCIYVSTYTNCHTDSKKHPRMYNSFIIYLKGIHYFVCGGGRFVDTRKKNCMNDQSPNWTQTPLFIAQILTYHFTNYYCYTFFTDIYSLDFCGMHGVRMYSRIWDTHKYGPYLYNKHCSIMVKFSSQFGNMFSNYDTRNGCHSPYTFSVISQ